MLEQLLDRCFILLDPQSDWPPSQDVECISVASLNLLRLQVSLHSKLLQTLVLAQGLVKLSYAIFRSMLPKFQNAFFTF